MKEMKYTSMRIFEILDRGFYNNYQYAIISYGTHPCCYIALEKGDKYYKVDYEKIDITCHGGLTYSRYGLGDIFSEEYRIIGWDYAHAGDYSITYRVRRPVERNGIKWSTEEMLKEVYNVIEQLNYINTRELLYF